MEAKIIGMDAKADTAAIVDPYKEVSEENQGAGFGVEQSDGMTISLDNVAVAPEPENQEPEISEPAPQPEEAASSEAEGEQPSPEPEDAPFVFGAPEAATESEAAPETETAEKPATNTVDPAFEKIEKAYRAGKLREYLELATADYDSMSDEAILKAGLKKEYPTLSEDDVNLILRKRLADLGINSDDEEAAKVGRVLLKAEADKIRNGLKQAQQEYVIPDTPAQQAAQQSDEQAKAAAMAEKFKEYFTTHSKFKRFETDRKIQFGEGDSAFNFAVPAEMDVVNPTINMVEFASKFWDDKGHMDIDRWLKTLAFAENMDAIVNGLINHGKELGKKESFDALPDPGAAPGSTQGAAPSSTPSIKIIGHVG